MSEAVLHACVVLAGLIAYVILTALSHDGNPVLSAALAWAGGAATQAKVSQASGA